MVFEYHENWWFFIPLKWLANGGFTNGSVLVGPRIIHLRGFAVHLLFGFKVDLCINPRYLECH